MGSRSDEGKREGLGKTCRRGGLGAAYWGARRTGLRVRRLGVRCQPPLFQKCDHRQDPKLGCISASLHECGRCAAQPLGQKSLPKNFHNYITIFTTLILLAMGRDRPGSLMGATGFPHSSLSEHEQIPNFGSQTGMWINPH